MGTCLRTLALFCLLAVEVAHGEVRSGVPTARDPLEEPRFESVGVGFIPRDVVAALAQDRSGLIWIATGDGLVRFDGYRFRAQERSHQDPARRSLGWIRTLLPARDGRLWIGTETDGLVVYDPATETVTDFGLGEAPGRSDEAAALPTVRALAEAADGSIWIGSLGGGVHRFDPTTRAFSSYRHVTATGSQAEDRVQALLVDRQGTLWVGSWHGLSRLPQGSRHIEPVAAGEAIGPQVQALYEAADGRIWAGTLHGVIAVLDPVSASVDGAAGSSLSNPASGAAVNGFAEVAGGEMWVARVSGIDIHDRSGHLVKRLRHDIRRPTGLAGNEVTALLRDQAGWLWAGGFGLGLQRHNPNNRSIWIRGADLQPGSRLDGPSVRSILQIDNGEIWAASQRGGVAVMDAQLRVVGEVLPRPAGRPADPLQLPASRSARRPPSPLDVADEIPQVSAMAQTRDGSVWLGSDNVVHRFSRDRRPLERISVGSGATNFLLAGSDGTLWIGTNDGLHRLPPGAGAAQRVAAKRGQPPFTGAVHAIAEAPDRAVWVGTLNGLFRIAPGERELVAVRSPAGAGLGNPSVAGLLFDRRQTLWVDTGVAGLHRMTEWDGSSASFDRISARHGIVNKPFGANLLDDGRGRIWTQIHVYDPANDQLSELTAVDGADLGTGWFSSRTRTADGRLLFGGSKGVMVVKPESFDVSDFAPSLLVSELLINGERRPAGQVPKGMRIEPEQRSFGIEFAALDYSDPLRIRYAYRLDGFDDDWIHTGAASRIASYSNLDPGRYVLHVRATNRNGVWSPHQLAIDVEVLPAWWQQWWFRLLALALLLALVLVAMRTQTRRVRLREQALEAKVAERTAELQLMSAALNESALTDPLTGLRNRRFLGLNIESDAALASRAHETQLHQRSEAATDADLIFFMFDIDHFKEVNDHFGHAAGDAVIVQTCARLKTIFRETDYLVRWGGEEFLVVARRTSRNHAVELAERARAAIADAPFLLHNGDRLERTCSVGFACFPVSRAHPHALKWEEALNLADACLYAVKRAGRNGWLGVLDAHGDSEQSVHESARNPLADWARSGSLNTACSPTISGWAGAQRGDKKTARV